MNSRVPQFEQAKVLQNEQHYKGFNRKDSEKGWKHKG
jgi:hypothetical protein